MAIESLAVWPILQSLLLIFMSFGLSFHEVTIALLGDHLENYRRLRNFALTLLVLTIGLFVLFGFSPLSLFWFQRVSGLTPELASFVQKPVQLLAPLPALWMVLTFQRSVLVNARRTAAITWATALDILLMALVLTLGIHYWNQIGVLAAAAALLAGRLGAVVSLVFPFSKTLRQAFPRTSRIPTPGESIIYPLRLLLLCSIYYNVAYEASSFLARRDTFERTHDGQGIHRFSEAAEKIAAGYVPTARAVHQSGAQL